MKNTSFLSASFLIGSIVLSSCSTNKMAAVSTDDNLYFMASDVELATKYAVDNNNPKSFENISEQPELVDQNFSSRNVNPEYISRYQTTETASTTDDGVVYFDEDLNQQASSGNINAYDNYSTNGNANGNGNGFNSPNINFNIGMGLGYGGMMMSPWGFYDPFWGPAWGFRPGLSIGFGLGFGRPFMGGFGNPYMMNGFGWGDPFMMNSFGWGNPYLGMGGFGGWGNPYGFGNPYYGGRPIYVLPGAEYGDRRVVSGARPTRGSSLANTGIGSTQAGVMPSTARAQARGNTSAVNNSSARRLVSSQNSRVASRDFSNSQNDYYNSSRGRAATTRNIASPASDRGSSTIRSRSAIPSARTTTGYSPNNPIRNYSPARSASPAYNGRTSSPSYNNRGTSPSFNRNSTPSYNNRSTSPSYNRSVTPSNRTVAPSRSNNSPSFSAPSRSSGGSISAPSRSSGGSSGSSSGGSRGGRGN